MKQVFLLFVLIFLMSGQAIAEEVPLVISSAVQPVKSFNQRLLQAQQHKRSWSRHPKEISSHFTGAGFDVIRVEHHQDSLDIYSLSHGVGDSPERLLILSLINKASFWQLTGAQFTWKCHREAFFSTVPCDDSIPLQ